MKPYLTRKEVIELLQVSDRTVSRKIKRGELKVVIRDKKQVFPLEQFENIKPQDKGVLDGVIEVLQEQLKEKDKQIEKLQEQIRKDSDLIQNEQVISKTFQDKFLLLPERTEPSKTQPKTQKPRKKPEQKPEKNVKGKSKASKKRGFFQRIFK